MGNSLSLRKSRFLSSQSSSPFTSEGEARRVWKSPDTDDDTGAVLFEDGSCYYGPQIQGKGNGFGILITPDDVEIEGYWEDGSLEGNALVIRPDGSQYLRQYRLGELKSEFTLALTVAPSVRRMVRAVSGLARASKSSSSSKASMTPSSSSDDLHKLLSTAHIMIEGGKDLRDQDLKKVPFGQRARIMAAAQTPPLYASTSSSTARVYVPRPPSQVETWLIPFDQLVFETRLSKARRCSSCSVLYKGTWLGKEVVIRVFSSAKSFDDEICSSLLSKMAKIRHPNIALFMAAAVSPQDNKLAIVTEFVVNGSLESIAKPSKPSNRSAIVGPSNLTAQNILHLAKGIAVGCAYLRKQGFSHKNLKPANVLIDSSLEIKLTDYFVKEFNELFHSPPCTADHIVFYLAPECLRLAPFVPFGTDTASDVYSFGMLCWEMVTGRDPYRGLTRAQIRVLVGHAGYREPNIHGGTLRGLPKLLEKCTVQEPEERPTFERIVVALNAMHDSANSAAEDALITFISGR